MRSDGLILKIFGVMGLVAVSVHADAGVGKVDYVRDVRPLFEKRCGACHGALKQKAGLRLDAGVLVMKGSEEGAVIKPGDVRGSLLITKVTATDIEDRMPPEGEGEALTDEQVDLLRRWITQGAVYPEDEKIAGDPREHWAYQTPLRGEVPWGVKAEAGNPIDAFIAARLRSRGLERVGFAEPGVWLRRVSLDLVGLPPTVDELTTFEAACAKGDAAAAKAHQQVIDHLLASERYGERWGRHWMDVWRYSDWSGFKNQLRGSARHIWRWRDWIVESLNADKGYDRMVMEMLAGDELAPLDADTLRATGFLARNFHHSNRNIWLDNTVEHTLKAFMGVTLNCARCHKHKYDPIDQEAYYRMRAVFEPHDVRTDRVGNQGNLLTDGLARAYDKEPEAVTWLYIRGSEKAPDKTRAMVAGAPDVFGGEYEVEEIELPLASYFPALVEERREASLKALRNVLNRAEKSLAAGDAKGDGANVVLLKLKRDEAAANLASREARMRADVAKYFEGVEGEAFEVLAVAAASAERSHSLAADERSVHEKRTALDKAKVDQKEVDEAEKKPSAAEAKKVKDPVTVAKGALTKAERALKTAKGAVKNEDGKYSSIGDVYPKVSTGRRTALGKWMTNRGNPLTARVAVNHMWMRHFGAPLVENMFDFGLRSPEPTHVKLLDWLAVELMESDWSMKRLHRLMVSSETYRLKSVVADGQIAEANRAIDPDNHELWKMNAIRLDAETIRDGVLSAAGSLDLTMGGAPVAFLEADGSRRRSVYLQNAYEKQARFMVIFDAASVVDCYRRSASVIPQQALAMSNSAMVLGESRKLAGKISGEVEGDGGFVKAAFMRVLLRRPTKEEFVFCVEFLGEQAGRLGDAGGLTAFGGGVEATVEPADDPVERARENLVHVLMNHHDFVTVR